MRAFYENTPIQTYWTFYKQKRKIFNKKSDIFHISAQNIDGAYSAVRDGSNE